MTPTSTLFFVPRPLILFRSNDTSIPVVVVNVLFIFSVMRVMREYLKIIGVMRNWYPLPPSPSPLPLCHPEHRGDDYRKAEHLLHSSYFCYE